MVSTTRVTHFGYAAVADGNDRRVQKPKVLTRKIHPRLAGAIGAVYFATSFALLNAGGAASQLILPLLGIAAALWLFVQRTVTLFAGWGYRRRLRRYAQQGLVVFVPLSLVKYLDSMHQKLGQAMHPTIFDVDLGKTNTLVELYKKEGLSPKVEELLKSLQ